mmetsp:Transcript_31504/g.81511  ORF Transcript_31504/g.81511 Transcript_31504/m.81511 type:complete len:583 (-) Transcript_31504:664-2412(-)
MRVPAVVAVPACLAVAHALPVHRPTHAVPAACWIAGAGGHRAGVHRDAQSAVGVERQPVDHHVPVPPALVHLVPRQIELGDLVPALQPGEAVVIPLDVVLLVQDHRGHAVAKVQLSPGGHLLVALTRVEVDLEACAIRRHVDEEDGGAPAAGFARHPLVALRRPLAAIVDSPRYGLDDHAANPLDRPVPRRLHHILHVVRREEIGLGRDVPPRRARHRAHFDLDVDFRRQRCVGHSLRHDREIRAGLEEHHHLAVVVHRNRGVLLLLVLAHVGGGRDDVVLGAQRARRSGSPRAEGRQPPLQSSEVEAGGGPVVAHPPHAGPQLRRKVGHLHAQEDGRAGAREGDVTLGLVHRRSDYGHAGEVLASQLDRRTHRHPGGQRGGEDGLLRGEAHPAAAAARDIDAQAEGAVLAADGHDPGAGGVGGQRQVEQRVLPRLRAEADADAVHARPVQLGVHFAGQLTAVKLLMARRAAVGVDQDVHIAGQLVHHQLDARRILRDLHVEVRQRVDGPLRDGDRFGPRVDVEEADGREAGQGGGQRHLRGRLGEQHAELLHGCADLVFPVGHHRDVDGGQVDRAARGAVA